MSYRRTLVLAGGVYAFLLAGFQAANAQILYGSVVGKITDPQGGSVALAKVSITNKDTGLTREAASDTVGNYEITNVVSGTYDLKVTAAGFSSAVRSDVQVTI